MVIGCDEAGRGPVLGSMFVCCVKSDVENIPNDVDDSKRLSQYKIETISELMQNNQAISYSIQEVRPSEIDDSENLTILTAKAMASAIRDVGYKHSDEIIVDSFSNNRKKASSMVRSRLDEDIDVLAEFGADEEYPVVSASSILAKNSREEHVSNLSESYDVGSGYPSDPNTKRFLEEYYRKHGDIPDFARRSWKTSQRIIESSD